MSKSKSKRAIKATRLDEKTSALVVAEFLVLGEVTEREVNSILEPRHKLSHREIAITFRVADVLGIPYAYEVAPRFRSVFSPRIRSVLSMICREAQATDERARAEAVH